MLRVILDHLLKVLFSAYEAGLFKMAFLVHNMYGNFFKMFKIFQNVAVSDVIVQSDMVALLIQRSKN